MRVSCTSLCKTDTIVEKLSINARYLIAFLCTGEHHYSESFCRQFFEKIRVSL